MPISGFLLVIAILPPWNYSKITARVLGLASRRRTKRGDRLPLIETLVLRVPLRLMLELFEKTLGLHLADAVVVVVGHDILLVNPPGKASNTVAEQYFRLELQQLTSSGQVSIDVSYISQPECASHGNIGLAAIHIAQGLSDVDHRRAFTRTDAKHLIVRIRARERSVGRIDYIVDIDEVAALQSVF